MRFMTLTYNNLVNNGICPDESTIKWILGELIHILTPQKELSNEDLDFMEVVIKMCNIIYNTRQDKELISDELYDRLIVLFGRYRPIPVGFEIPNKILSPMIEYIEPSNNPTVPMYVIDHNYHPRMESSIFADKIINYENYIGRHLNFRDIYDPNPVPLSNEYINKGLHATQHEYPELVGTLDKCKFVIDKDAEDIGVLEDQNVTILERDWFKPLIEKGIINPTKVYTMVLELKYDGVSVEADCNTHVASARSRGEVGIGMAVDYTPILKGYRFPHYPFNETLGVKFEAIILKHDLARFNYITGKDYKNCRTAIVGLMSSSDANQYRDFFTLIPLQVESKVYDTLGSRVAEIEFLNNHLVSKGCPLVYTTISGTYDQLLFQIREFVKDAEFARDYMPYMYDGIVVSFDDNEIRHRLGRENFINKWSMAVKFRPMKKFTKFIDYSYTVGQNGVITPMLHYEPVEFYGTIHTVSSAHSLKRFEDLDLHYGDMICVEYVNDVMPYVSTVNQINPYARGPKATFIKYCPSCEEKLSLSDSGKSIICTNMHCTDRTIARMVNMFDKLNMFEFGESTIKRIGKHSLYTLCKFAEIGFDGCGFGEVEKSKLIDQIDRFKITLILDYNLFGALGFSNVAKKTWGLIFNNIRLSDLLTDYLKNTNKFYDIYYSKFVSIKGIGPVVANTIINEFEFFLPDIIYCKNLGIIAESFNTKSSSKSIRFTGFRNPNLATELCEYGFDADMNGSVTKSTDILLVPYEGFTSSKTSKVSPTCIIITPEELMANIDKYI